MRPRPCLGQTSPSLEAPRLQALENSIALRLSRPAPRCFVLISMVSRHWSWRLALKPVSNFVSYKLFGLLQFSIPLRLFFFARARCLSAGLGNLKLTRLPRHDPDPVPGGNRYAASCLCTALRRALYHYTTRSPSIPLRPRGFP